MSQKYFQRAENVICAISSLCHTRVPFVETVFLFCLPISCDLQLGQFSLDVKRVLNKNDENVGVLNL